MVTRYWLHLEEEYKNVKLDEYIVMPDHMHMIIWLTKEMSDDIHPSHSVSVRAGLVPAPLRRQLLGRQQARGLPRQVTT